MRPSTTYAPPSVGSSSMASCKSRIAVESSSPAARAKRSAALADGTFDRLLIDQPLHHGSFGASVTLEARTLPRPDGRQTPVSGLIEIKRMVVRVCLAPLLEGLPSSLDRK